MGIMSFIASKVAPDEAGTGGITDVVAKMGDGAMSLAVAKAAAANIGSELSGVVGGMQHAESASAPNVGGSSGQSKGGQSL